jgi:hypothetical protein
VTVKRSGREARRADIPPARNRFRAAYRWLPWRRERVEAEPPSPVELETIVAEIVVTEIAPRPVVTEHPLERPGLEEAEPSRAAAPPATEAREWNIWDLERRARAQAGDAARDQEWAALFMHLRQFANADGVLPTQFDGLVRESFSKLIQAA